MKHEKHQIGPLSSAAQVLETMLSNQVIYPCLSAMIYKLAETLQGVDEPLSQDCWSELNEILSGSSDPASVRRFVARHSGGSTMESRAFRDALMYLINEDESRRDQYRNLGTPERQHFIKSRLWQAGEMQVQQAIAL